MTTAQTRAINNIVNEFKREYPNARVVVKESGNCFIDGKKVVNFNSIINEHDKNNSYFIKTMRDFYEKINTSDINLSTDKVYSVIMENRRRSLKFLGKKDDNEFVFQETSTSITPSTNNKYYLTKKEVKDIFSEYV